MPRATPERSTPPTESYEAHPDATTRLLFFLTVGALLLGVLVAVLILLL